MNTLAKILADSAALLRTDGMPDAINRLLTAKPEDLMSKPIGPREQMLREQRAAKRAFNPYEAEHKQAKKEKTQARIAKLKAVMSGATTAMPLTGKAALAKINEPPPASAGANQEEKNVDNLTSTNPETASTAPDALRANAIKAGIVIPIGKARKAAKAAGKPKGSPKKAAGGKAKAKPAKRASAAPKAKKKAKTAKAPRAAKTEGVRPGTKLELVVGLLQRKSGCTTADVLEATGWPAISMPQMARAAGLKLRKEKDGSVSRYWAA